MKPDIIKITDGDVVMVHYNVGCLAVEQIDAHCTEIIEHLKNIFGCNVALFPQREMNGSWDFTIIRNPVRKYPFCPDKKKIKKLLKSNKIISEYYLNNPRKAEDIAKKL